MSYNKSIYLGYAMGLVTGAMLCFSLCIYYMPSRIHNPEDIAELALDIINKPEKYTSGTDIILWTNQEIEELIKK